jgi:hypothetical protein
VPFVVLANARLPTDCAKEDPHPPVSTLGVSWCRAELERHWGGRGADWRGAIGGGLKGAVEEGEQGAVAEDVAWPSAVVTLQAETVALGQMGHSQCDRDAADRNGDAHDKGGVAG